MVAARIEEWLWWGNVRPWIRWLQPQPTFTLAGGTFGILAFQMMLAVTNTHGLAVCTGCGNPYLRQNRKPQLGRRNYCPGCRERKVGARDRKRAQRARRREQHGEQASKR